jgi:hypothetical protein
MLSNAGGGSKSASEIGAAQLLSEKGLFPPDGSPEEVIRVLYEHGYEVRDESKEWEHSEPGTGNPPQPRKDEDGSDDIAIREGWRRETPPIAEDPPQTSQTGNEEGRASEGSVTNLHNTLQSTNVTKGGKVGDEDNGNRSSTLTIEQEYELRNIFGINGDGDLIEAARLQFGEMAELRKSVDVVTQEKKFAEEYPAFWQEHNDLMEKNRKNDAKAFSESVSRVRKAEGYGLKETQKGLSAMSLQKVQEVHKKFAEHKATLEDFEDCIRTIVNGGIVTFGELGSDATEDVPLVDTTTSGGIVHARKLFAEQIGKIQADNPEWDYTKCMDEAAKKHPDLAEAYAVALPG